MAFTGTQILNDVNQLFDDAGDQVWAATQKLAALNRAISASFPYLKNMLIDSSVTLASGTFEYTPTAGLTTTDGYTTLEEGFADHAYVVSPSASLEAKLRLGGISQRLSNVTWSIVVPPRLATEFSGLVLHLGYNARVPRITAVGDSIELPYEYLANYVQYWLCTAGAFNNPKFDVKIFADQVPEWRAQYQAALQANRRGYTMRMPIAYDHGGASLVPTPIEYTGTVSL